MTTKEQEKNGTPEIDLMQFWGGTQDRYQCGVNPRVLFSGGVRYLAEKANAYWLVDAIASYLVPDVLTPHIRKDRRIGYLHFWQLRVRNDQRAVLAAVADTGESPFIVQTLDYTDFPLSKADIWAGQSGDHWTLYLPQEH